MRNLTVRTYEENQADKVIEILPLFSQEIIAFLNAIGAHDVSP